MTVTLRPLTAENWRECSKLEVAKDQSEFVAPNLYSIAQARFEPTCVTVAIYADEVMVGFVMYDASENYLVRFMVDARYQGKGYGRAALILLIKQFEREGTYPTASLSYVPGNAAAEHLYESLGFKPTGEVDDGEIVMVRPLSAG